MGYTPLGSVPSKSDVTRAALSAQALQARPAPRTPFVVKVLRLSPRCSLCCFN